MVDPIIEEAELDPERWEALPANKTRIIVPSMMRTQPAVKLEIDGGETRAEIQAKLGPTLGRRGR